MQVYSKTEQVRQKAIQNLQYEEEQSPSEFNIGAMVCNKRQVGVEKKGVVLSGHDPSHQTKQNKALRNSLYLKSNISKFMQM